MAQKSISIRNVRDVKSRNKKDADVFSKISASFK